MLFRSPCVRNEKSRPPVLRAVCFIFEYFSTGRRADSRKAPRLIVQGEQSNFGVRFCNPTPRCRHLYGAMKNKGRKSFDSALRNPIDLAAACGLFRSDCQSDIALSTTHSEDIAYLAIPRPLPAVSSVSIKYTPLGFSFPGPPFPLRRQQASLAPRRRKSAARS